MKEIGDANRLVSEHNTIEASCVTSKTANMLELSSSLLYLKLSCIKILTLSLSQCCIMHALAHACDHSMYMYILYTMSL